MSQWCTRNGNAATPWTNINDSCWNETRSCQDDAIWYITRSYERLCWEFEQNKTELLFWKPCPRIFRIAHGYLLLSLIFPHSLRIFKDFGTQITNTAVFVKIFIFQKLVLFSIWRTVTDGPFVMQICTFDPKKNPYWAITKSMATLRSPDLLYINHGNGYFSQDVGVLEVLKNKQLSIWDLGLLELCEKN